MLRIQSTQLNVHARGSNVITKVWMLAVVCVFVAQLVIVIVLVNLTG